MRVLFHAFFIFCLSFSFAERGTSTVSEAELTTVVATWCLCCLRGCSFHLLMLLILHAHIQSHRNETSPIWVTRPPEACLVMAELDDYDYVEHEDNDVVVADHDPACCSMIIAQLEHLQSSN